MEIRVNLKCSQISDSSMIYRSRPTASHRHKHLFALFLACLIVSLTLQNARAQSNRDVKATLDDAFKQLKTLELGQPLETFGPIEQAVAAARTDDKIRSELEGRLLAVLQGDATNLAKDYACRQLAIMGSDAALPVLAELLANSRLSHMARYALEAIGGPAARKTLRDMLASTEGAQKIGIVISLGRLSDAEAVVAIASLLDGADKICEAALVALGRIGSVAAAEALRDYAGKAPQSLRDEVADALLAAAESLRKQGKLEPAEEIYRSLLSETTQEARAGAYRGLILTRPEQAPGKICEGLASDEDWKREVAAGCLVQLDEPDQIDAVASAIADLPSAGKVAAFVSLHRHRHAAIRQAALNSLDDSEIAVQTAALVALVSSGTAEDVPRLANLISMTDDPRVGKAVSESLRLMPGKDIDRALVSWMMQVKDIDPALVRAALTRRSPELIPAFLRAAESGNSETRLEAFAALEVMAVADNVEALVALLCRTPPGQEREAVGRTVWMSCQKIVDPAARSAPLLAAMKNGGSAAKCAILPTLARIGGSEARAAVEEAMQSEDPATRDAGYRALANWPDASVAERLIEIAKTSDSEMYRIWALRAYARVVALPSKRPAAKTFEMLSEAMKLANRNEDRELIVTRLATVRTPAALAMLLSLLDESELRIVAAEAVFESAKGLSRSHPQQAREALERIQPMITNPELLQQLPKVLRDIEARQSR
jgi:HEAT repeat protein